MTRLDDAKIDERAAGKLNFDEAFIREGIEAAVKRAERKFNASKAAVSDSLEDGKVAAERLFRRGRAAADGYLDDATYQVRHNPRAAVALAFGVGAVAGVFFGLLTRPRGKEHVGKSLRSPEEA